jgi:Domain of Unknown Function with PDB structure (DUF3862)
MIPHKRFKYKFYSRVLPAWPLIKAGLVVVTCLLGPPACTAEESARESAFCVDQGIVSYEMYERIREGMSVSDLQQLLGTRRMVERSQSGRMRTYGWANDDGSNLLVTVEDAWNDATGVVRSKAQAGLARRPYVTCRDFERLYNGIDVTEVQSRLAGRSVPQVTQLSPTEFLWTWTNANGSYLKLLFRQSKLVNNMNFD